MVKLTTVGARTTARMVSRTGSEAWCSVFHQWLGIVLSLRPLDFESLGDGEVTHAAGRATTCCDDNECKSIRMRVNT